MPVSCRYCFNLNHWTPVSLVAAVVECRVCSVCPMYVPLSEWDEHQQHNGETASPIVLCPECPMCRGLIEPDAAVAPCRICEPCKSYVPVELWEQHIQEGCWPNDPFKK